MSIWIIVLIVITLATLTTAILRLKIPRDPSREGIDNADSALAFDRVSRSFLFHFFRFIVIQQLKKFRPRGILSDIGCGPGYLASSLSRQFPGLEVIGIDYSEDMIRLARRNFNNINKCKKISFKKADVVKLPFKDNFLDFVVSTLSLHHWAAANQAMEELHRVLKPEGRMLVFDLRRDEPLLAYYVSHLVQRFFSPAAIHRVNGAIGSIWSSYTPAELEELMASSPFRNGEVKTGWGWAYIWAQKPKLL